MNPSLTVSLFFGFIAKEVLLGAMAVQLPEARSRGFVVLSVVCSLGLAWLMALLLFQGGRLLIG